MFSVHHAGLDEVQQVVRPAGLAADAREADAAERLAADHRAGDAAVEIEVAHAEALRRRRRTVRGLRLNRPPVSVYGGASAHVAAPPRHSARAHREQRPEDLLVRARATLGPAGPRPTPAWRTFPSPGARRRASGDDPALGLRRLRVALDPVLGGLLDHRRRRRCRERRLADHQHLHGADQPLEQRVVRPPRGRAPGGGRALLARSSRRPTARRRARPRRGRPTSTMTQFLPPISAITFLTNAGPGVAPAASRTISRPTAFEPVKAIMRTRGSRHEGRPGSPSPGSSAARRSARRPRQRASHIAGAAARLRRRLDQRGIAHRQRGRRHAAANGQREVPRAITRRTPRGGVAHGGCTRRAPGAARRRAAGRASIARRGRSTRRSRSPRRCRRRPRARASRLAGPARAASSSRRSRSQAAAPSSTSARSARRPGGPFRRAPRWSRSAPRGDVLLAGRRRPARPGAGIAGVRRDELLALAAVVADPDRYAQRRAGVERVERLLQRRPGRRAAQLEHGLVDEVPHGAASSSSRGTPSACWARNESLAVFSSSRRTR